MKKQDVKGMSTLQVFFKCLLRQSFSDTRRRHCKAQHIRSDYFVTLLCRVTEFLLRIVYGKFPTSKYPCFSRTLCIIWLIVDDTRTSTSITHPTRQHAELGCTKPIDEAYKTFLYIV